MKNNSLKEIWSRIKNSKKVLMSLHYGPDGDSLGSCIAMKYILEEMGKEVVLVSRDKIEQTLSELKYTKDVEFGKDISFFDWNNFDLVIALDTGDKKQFLPEEFEIPYKDKLMVIDHHITNNGFGGMNYINSNRISTCSILLDLFIDNGVEIDYNLATMLLLGIYTDSGFFSHDNGQSIKDADFLIGKGAEYKDGIVDKVRYNTPLKIKKYFALAVDNFKQKEVNGFIVGWSSVSEDEIRKLNLNLSEARGAINYLQEIGGIDILFTLTELKEIIKGSFRSRKNIDVSLFAEALGGGGHRQAAAFKFSKMPLNEAEKKVFEVIDKIGIHRF